MPMVLACVLNNFLFSPREVWFRFLKEGDPGLEKEGGEEKAQKQRTERTPRADVWREVQISFRGEGEESFRIRAGLDGTPRIFSQTINGEPFLLGASARMAEDEEGRPVLKVCLSFLETPSSKEMKFIFYEHGSERKHSRILLRYKEFPDAATAGIMLTDLLAGGGEHSRPAQERAALEEKIRTRMKTLFEPRRKGLERRSLGQIVDRELPGPAEERQKQKTAGMQEHTAAEP